MVAEVVRRSGVREGVLVAQSLTSFDLRARNWRDEAERLLGAIEGGTLEISHAVA